jgi:hypothetical protein
MTNLRNSKAPNLLVAPIAYDKQYQDQLNNALRLYFTQLDNFNQVAAEQIASNTVMAWMDM